MAEKEKPKKEFRAGSVRATVWENQRSKDGREFSVASVHVERRYRDADGNWQSTSTFGIRELSLLQLVAAKAFEYLAVTEREPNGEE